MEISKFRNNRQVFKIIIKTNLMDKINDKVFSYLDNNKLLIL